MIERTELFAKDRVKLNLLSALLDGGAEMTLYLESDGRELPFAEVRSGKEAVYRYNNFRVEEDPASDVVAFCPVVVGCLAVISVTIRAPLTAPRLEIVRGGIGVPDRGFPLGEGKNRFALSPIGMKKYTMLVETPPSKETERNPSSSAAEIPAEGRKESLARQNAELEGDIALMEREISGLEAKRASLAERKRLLKARLEWLLANAEKDEGSEIEELKATFAADEDILACYAEQNEDGVEKLVAQVRADIEKLEDQIGIFVRRRREKALDIERSLRFGR